MKLTRKTKNNVFVRNEKEAATKLESMMENLKQSIQDLNTRKVYELSEARKKSQESEAKHKTMHIKLLEQLKFALGNIQVMENALIPVFEQAQTQRFFGQKHQPISETETIPDLSKPLEELQKIKLIKMHFKDKVRLCMAFGISLSDGQQKIDGTAKEQYLLPESPLTEISMTYGNNEVFINYMTLVFADGTSKRLGASGKDDGRVDTYKFARDEYIIGATMEHSAGGFLMAVTFHTIKRTN